MATFASGRPGGVVPGPLDSLRCVRRATRDRPWLTRNLKVLSGVSLAQDAASELMYPLLPVLLTTTLGAPASIVGIVEGIAEGTSAALKYVSGRLSDRTGRKPVIVAGYGLAAAGKALVAAALVWPVVLAGRVVDRIGKGIRGAPRDALLADGIPAHALGRAYGFHRAADTAGAVIGPLLGVAILSLTDQDVGAALWLAVVPALVSVALVALVREAPRTTASVEPPRPRPSRAATSWWQRRASRQATSPREPRSSERPRLPPRARSLAALLGLFALVNFPDALVLLRVHELGYSPAEVMAAYALFNLANATVSFPAGALSDRWRRSRVYALGLACFAVGYGGLGMVDHGWPVVLLLTVYGGFAGITEGVGRAWMTALTPPDMRGHAQGLLQGLSGGGILLAGVWAGLAWSAGPGSGVVPLLVSAGAAALAATGLWAFGRRLDTPAA